MKSKARIISIDDQEQIANIVFEYYSVGKWWGSGRYYHILEVTVVDDLKFVPSDLDLDLEVAFAEALGADPRDINMRDCIVTYQVTVPMDFEEVMESKEYNEMLFI